MDTYLVKGHIEQGMAVRLANRDLVQENELLRAKLAEDERMIAVLLAARERRHEIIQRNLDALRAENEMVRPGILRRIIGKLIVKEER